jgi:hypothetical protein
MSDKYHDNADYGAPLSAHLEHPIPSQPNSVNLVWGVSTDDGGIAGSREFRNVAGTDGMVPGNVSQCCLRHSYATRRFLYSFLCS